VKDPILKKVIDIADFTIEFKATTRQTAENFGVSKSSVHKYLTKYLPKIDPGRYQEVRQILDYNDAMKHVRGGRALVKKYGSKIGIRYGVSAQ
jgi:putative DeoR family transcriptional regulator (stage III sporulation protein D)